MGRGLGKTVRMNRKLLSKVDNAVRTVKNELNQRRFSDRREFLDQAVRKFLITQKGIK